MLWLDVFRDQGNKRVQSGTGMPILIDSEELTRQTTAQRKQA
jgi:hypothetical protein